MLNKFFDRHNHSVLYMVQAYEKLPEKYSSIKDRCILLSYGEESRDTDIYFPGSTWTTGRNKLHEYASALETRASYYIFLDEDIEFEGVQQEDGFKYFESMLKQIGAPIIVPDCWGYNGQTTSIAGLPKDIQRKALLDRKLARQAVDWFDGAFIAISAGAFFDPRLLPYASNFDDRSWWASQFIMILRANVLYRNNIIQINQLRVNNSQQSSYPRGFDGFIDAYNMVLNEFKTNRIRMTSKPDALIIKRYYRAFRKALTSALGG